MRRLSYSKQFSISDKLTTMPNGWCRKPILLVVLVCIVPGEFVLSQENHQRAPDASNPELIGNVRKHNDSALSANERLHGAVSLSDGTMPKQAVEINASCPTSNRLMAIADSRAKFSFSFDVNRQSDNELTKPGCALSASLQGYRSETKSIAELIDRPGTNFGKIILEQISPSSDGLTSTVDSQVSTAQKNSFRKALDKASKQDYKGAISVLEELVSENRNYSSAWLTLGIVQQVEGNVTDAEKSYLEASRADSKFASPLIHAAALEIFAGNIHAALIHSQKAIDLNPNAFPEAYWLNSEANITVGNMAAAEKSAQTGITLDTAHHYPDLEYVLGMALYSKNDYKSAKDHLQRYIDQSPKGLNTIEADKRLVQMKQADMVIRQLAFSARSQEKGPASMHALSNQPPPVELFRASNAPMLQNLSAYTCLESITTLKVDVLGHPLIAIPTRVEVAVSNGKEIYGPADGKGFSGNSRSALPNYNFFTTGLFSSIARSLVLADQLAIEPVGEIAVGEKTYYRYNFNSLPGTAGWAITYSGQSGNAGEQGWFLVDSKSHLLRRALVSASNIPENLKLISLGALIDYEPETIAGHRVLLPSTAKIDVREQSGIQHTSFISFDHWRAFSVESIVLFEDPSNDSRSKGAGRLSQLPPSLNVLISLNSPLSISAAENSDVITGTTMQPVYHHGQKIIEAGALIEGHVRTKWGDNGIIVELDQVQTPRGWAPFYAELLKLTSEIQVQIERPSEEYVQQIASDSEPIGYLPNLAVPGMATLTFPIKGFVLPAGTPMLWKTEALLPVSKTDADASILDLMRVR